MATKTDSGKNLPKTVEGVMVDGKPLRIDSRYSGVMGGTQTKEAWLEGVKTLADSIHVNGVEDPVLVLDRGDHAVLLIGHRRVYAVAHLLSKGIKTTLDGKPLTLPVTYYKGADDEVSIVARITRAKLSRTQLGEKDKRRLILNYLAVLTANKKYDASTVISEDLGYSQTYIAQVRREAQEAGRPSAICPDGEHKGKVVGRDLVWKKANYNQPPKKKTKDKPEPDKTETTPKDDPKPEPTTTTTQDTTNVPDVVAFPGTEKPINVVFAEHVSGLSAMIDRLLGEVAAVPKESVPVDAIRKAIDDLNRLLANAV